ncbi:TIGR03545 family protein [Pleionea litopenaei]|uniref:TIGR03545 family protein n=1 Tax=Pleionea litopenaei TaxID=3070815 RepID=A0AA51X6J6_9GAMM|nr:TIGR03545 family protein [Pleionea sp. HL-JVS1]WMS86919.1 TIGR03545 family protein [Pleionea sp. HL-JVS1]
MKIFRLSGIFILLFVCGLTWALIAFLAGSWIEESVEQQGSQINGATVSVSSSRLGWMLNSLNIESLQIANPSDLNKNRIEIGQLKFGVNLASLFKQQLHVDELVITDVRLNQPRKSPAQLVDSGAWSPNNWQWPKAVMEEAKSVDTDALLKQVNIRSPEMYQQFSSDLTATKARWQQQQSELPDSSTLEQWKAEYNQLQEALKKAKGLEKIAKAKELKDLVKKIDQAKNRIDDFRKAIVSDTQSSKQKWRQLQAQVTKDTELAMSIVSLSPEGIQHLAASFLGEDIAHWVKLAMDNSALVSRLGAAKENEKETPEPRTGIDVNLTGEEPLPDVWIQKALLGGDFRLGDVSGRLTGEAVNLSSQLVAGKPLTSSIDLTVPQTSKDGIEKRALAATGNLKFMLKKQQNGAALQGDVALNNWPIDNWTIGSGGLNLTDVKAQVRASLEHIGAQSKLKFDIQLTDFIVNSPKDLSGVSKTFAEILQENKKIILTVLVVQHEKEMKTNISSNLDKLFFAKIKDQYQSKADNTKAELRDKIDAQLKDTRSKIEQQLSGLSDLEKQVSDKLQELDGLK